MKKIDVHCHTTNRIVADVDTPIPSISAIEKIMIEYEVEKTNLLATYFPHKQSGITNFRLLDWIGDRLNFSMFASLDFQYYPKQGLNEIKELADRGKIAGIKIYTCYQVVDLESSTFKQLIEIAKRHSLPMMFHTGLSYASMRKYNTPTVAEMFSAKRLEETIFKNPSVNFILSHMSKPFFEEIEYVCKRYPNAFTDMSGLIDSTYDSLEIPSSIGVIKKFLEICGPHKLMFGTDFPVQTHKDSINFIEEAMKGFSDKDKEDVYYYNADRIIYLKNKP